MDCGPTCLRMVAKFYGKSFSLDRIRKCSYLTKEGASLMGLSHAAESLGFKTRGARIQIDTLEFKTPLPCIIPWNNNHFVVLYKIKKGRFFIADPNDRKKSLTKGDLQQNWSGDKKDGVVLLFEPTPRFYKIEQDCKLPLIRTV